MGIQLAFSLDFDTYLLKPTFFLVRYGAMWGKDKPTFLQIILFKGPNQGKTMQWIVFWLLRERLFRLIII